MAAHKKTDRICCAVLILSVLITVLFMNGEALGLTAKAAALGYETRLFDTTKVHTIDIVMDGWDTFIDGCEDEEYASCAVVIDGESYKNVAIRAKGNTSLSSVRQLGSQRYSFKLEFDHYESGKTYHGLDKLCLNNLIQDNTMMKDYLVYRLMGNFGVASPLCSFVYITVNGEDWGLYLAVEGVEDAFLERNYGANSGELSQTPCPSAAAAATARILTWTILTLAIRILTRPIRKPVQGKCPISETSAPEISSRQVTIPRTRRRKSRMVQRTTHPARLAANGPRCRAAASAAWARAM